MRPGPTARQRRNDVFLALGLAAGVVFSVELARSAGMSLGGGDGATGDDVDGHDAGGQGSAEQRPHTPAPGLEQLSDLVAGCAQDGLQVDLAVVGEARPVPASVAVSVYRVTQEALTNTMKHAAARQVNVRLRYLPSAIEVEGVDDGRARSNGGGGGVAPDAAGHVGMGHVGMRERLMLHDGELEVGPRNAGG